MIVCHCNRLTDHDIRRAVDELITDVPLQMITPRTVYNSLSKPARCGGCFPLALKVITEHLAARMAEAGTPKRAQPVVADRAALAAE